MRHGLSRACVLGRALLCLSVGLIGTVSGCDDPVVEQVSVEPPDIVLSGPERDAGSPSRTDASPDATSPPEPECGNGVVEGREECDDGGRSSGDGCSKRCRLEWCGDGKVDDFERCDDGNRLEGDGCDARCRIEEVPACGNGEIDEDEGETCDDGNLEGGDGCDESCQIEECGDGKVALSETCDPPLEGYCDDECQRVLPDCGNGEVDEPEECDDGNDAAGDGCDHCWLECGDGVIDSTLGEQCEPPGNTSGRACSADCRWEPVCGDGVFQSESEECDASSTRAVPAGMRCEACQLVLLQDGPGNGDAGVDGGSSDAGIDVCEVQGPTIVPASGFEGESAALPWQPRTRVSAAHVADGGLLASGGLLVTFVPPSGVDPDDTRWEQSGAQRCVSVRGSTPYDARVLAFTRSAGGFGSNVRVQLRAKGFKTVDCTGNSAYEATNYSSQRPAENAGWVSVETTIEAQPDTQSVLLELAVAKPRPATAEVVWDNVQVVANNVPSHCGNCKLDEGELCDDGNRLDRDGCSQTCQLEVCGDTLPGEDEACDDGVTLWSEGAECTPACQRKDCLDSGPGCSAQCNACIADDCQNEVAAALDLPGRAEAGPRLGELRSVLAEELRTCVHRTGCAGGTAIAAVSAYGPSTGALENCYCGGALDDTCYEQGAANGSCRAEVEAVVESTEAAEVWRRIGSSDGSYPLAAAVTDLLWCEGVTADALLNRPCQSECTLEPRCGDGVLQDRLKADADALVARYEQPVSEFFFERCDDGNTEDGDGCGADCLPEVCGNGLVQFDEECDDGNTEDGDGCSATCEAEFECGDGEVTQPFETCEPGQNNPDTVCTEDEFKANPGQCHCDSVTCQRVWCGDGEKMEGEACEDPGEGICGLDCQFTDDNACMTCITDPEGSFYPVLGPTVDTCLDDADCASMLACMTETKCANAATGETNPAECICGYGSDIDACFAESVEAKGECLDELLAFSPQGLPIPDLANYFVNSTNPSGLAYSLYNPAATNPEAGCDAPEDCGGPANDPTGDSNDP